MKCGAFLLALATLVAGCGGDAPPPPADPRPAPPPRAKKAVREKGEYEKRYEAMRKRWPPTREALAGLIPEYEALEARLIRAANEHEAVIHARGDRAPWTEAALLERIGQTWNGLHSDTGDTPTRNYIWAMQSHDMDAPLAPIEDGEPAGAVKVTGAAGRRYLDDLPAAPEGVDECWKRIVIRGTFDRGTHIVINGQEGRWAKLVWCPDLLRWTRRTLAERKAFQAAHAATIRDEIEKARTLAEAGPVRTLEAGTRLEFVVDAFVPEFRRRYLEVFLVEYYPRMEWPE